MRRAARQRAFTLLEMLVVLVLTGLVTTLLLQALYQVLRLQDQSGREVFRMQHGAMREAWYRQAINGLVPDHDKGEHRFRGDRRELHGLTLAPLASGEGILEPFALRLRFDPARGETLLQFGAPDDAPVALSWPGDSGRFFYVDADGRRHDTWPPFLGRESPPLPAAIHLEASIDGTPRILVAAPRGPTSPSNRRRDVENL